MKMQICSSVKVKKQKPPKGRVNVSLTLEARLRDMDDPVLGLNAITEYREQSNGKMGQLQIFTTVK